MHDAEEFRYLVLAAQREGARLIGLELKPLGVTTAQGEVLRVLQDHQPLTLNGLGELLVCETGTSPSRLVDRLCAAGLVNRQPGVLDRRHIELTLTPEGREVAERIADIEQRFYQRIRDSAQGGDLQHVNDYLRAFVGELPTGRALARRIRLEQS
ncbi:MarR family transcriptional regulator [Nocardia sp. NBC_00565]|uniref:MarR family winged helix-turn-helix transcriptional regulator n=1 Tax=Nocardia sp. NBC_00565 TaxID=2975993 RepID=UPI002E81B2AC|nr:MarR family transcriptional regulator [Nocardia sp. NBC_00565]WUC00849.1 MarR family transcriptional regulator [Nocardia sp. NBC_00565]